MWHSNRWTNIAFATCGDQERRHCCTYPWPQELSAARGSLHSADTADASHGFCCTIPATYRRAIAATISSTRVPRRP
ncbi:hypothetical protein JG688_00007307 [Phytophthora aleatoria]|uniref:Uncharacterized protein n=1 Tax=Phytophthora aleatoria TaxID=2496075 RepID=A0A8J5IPJ7_9STRA|nr:hypothetical protein JG688_00007307 [Phytophthora aleatoria]